MKRLNFLLVMLLLASSLQAQIYYKVTVPAPETKVVKVEATFPLIRNMLIMYVNPFNQLKDGQATFVQNLKVIGENGKSINYKNMGVGDWKLKTSKTNQKVKLSYEVRLEHDKYQWPIGKDEIAYKTSEGLFFVGQSLFITPGYGTKDKIQVEFVLPNNWKATTPWVTRKTSAKSNASYQVDRLYALLRNCFFLGSHQEEKVQAGNFNFTLVVGKKFQAAKPLFIDIMKPTVKAYLKMFGGSKSNEYLVIINEDYRTDGGAFNNSYSMVINGEVNKASSVVWAHGMAHEILHLWNGITIRPRGQEEWFKEGFTDYMTVVLMAQNKLIDKNILYKRLENFQRKYLIAKFMQGIKASIRASGKQKQRNRMLVYGGGALVAFCLDVEMRSANNNTKGVYDLMREMYEQFGKTDKRYTLDDIIQIANKLAGKDLKPFFEKYVNGKAYLDIGPYLQKAGLQISGFFEEVFVSPRPNAPAKQQEILKGIFGL